MLTRVTVTTPAANRNLTQLATVKTELVITGSTDDAFLTTLIKQASSAIETFCNRTFAAQTYTEVWRLQDFRERLALSQFPLVSVTSLTEGTDALAETTDWEGYYNEGLLGRIIGDFPARWRTRDRITAQYISGFSLPGDSPLSPVPAQALPSDIERACIELVKTEYLSRQRNPNVQREEVPDVYSVSYMFKAVPGAAGGYALPPNIAGMLTAYRDLRAI